MKRFSNLNRILQAETGDNSLCNRTISLFTLVAVISGFCAGAPLASAQSDDAAQIEYKIKAGFLFNFLKFVSIPQEEGRDEDVWRIGVLGDNNVLRTVRDTLAGKSSDGRSVEVSAISNDEDLARLCHIIFIPERYAQSSAALVRAIEDSPILVVGESKHFALKHGIIGFVKKKSLRMEINPTRAKKAGLVISGKLSSLSTIVGN